MTSNNSLVRGELPDRQSVPSASGRTGVDVGAPNANELLLLAANYPPSKGGIQTAMRELALRMPAESSVLAPAQEGDREFDSQIRCYTRRAQLQKFHNYAAPVAIARHLLTFRHTPPRMIICDHVVSAIAVQMVRPVMSCPYTVFVHGRELDQRPTDNGLHLRTRLFEATLRRAHRVFVMSKFVQERTSEYGISADRIVRVPMGTDHHRFARSPRIEEIRARHDVLGKPVIGTLGRVVDRKGHDQVIRALPRLLEQFPDLHYWIIGRGPCRPDLERLANEFDVRQHVVFLEEVSDKELPDYLSALDVMVMPSKESKTDVEGFGLVFLEAGACEVPVVGGRSGGISSAVRDGETGLLCDPQSIDDVADCVLKLLGDPAYARQLGQNARQWVMSEMNWDNFAKSVLREVEEEAAPV